MADIALFYNQGTNRFDWDISSGDIAVAGVLSGTSDLETAVILSLFCDRLANPDYVLPKNVTDRRGWWGDVYEPTPSGSNLWQLKYIPKTNNILQIAVKMCNDALQWMITDGVAASVVTTANWYAPNRTDILVLNITITEPVTLKQYKFKYS